MSCQEARPASGQSDRSDISRGRTIPSAAVEARKPPAFTWRPRDGDHEPWRQGRKVRDRHQPGGRAGAGLGRAGPSDRSRSAAARRRAVSQARREAGARAWPTSSSTRHRPLRDAIVDAGPHRFDVVLAGSTVAPIHELFRSPRLEALLQEAREQYDYVVLDTPPLGPVSDCALLARWIDGVLLVVAAHRTSRKLLEETLNLLEDASVLGIVFNGDDRRFLRYRRHSYRDYFSAGHTGPPRPCDEPRRAVAKGYPAHTMTRVARSCARAPSAVSRIIGLSMFTSLPWGRVVADRPPARDVAAADRGIGRRGRTSVQDAPAAGPPSRAS